MINMLRFQGFIPLVIACYPTGLTDVQMGHIMQTLTQSNVFSIYPSDPTSWLAARIKAK